MSLTLSFSKVSRVNVSRASSSTQTSQPLLASRIPMARHRPSGERRGRPESDAYADKLSVRDRSTP